MRKLIACIALVFFTLFASAASAQTDSAIAKCTIEALARSTNPFTGRTGITDAEAARLHLGTPITLPNGSMRALEPKGASVWRLCREYLTTAAPANAGTVATPKPEPQSTAEQVAQQQAEEIALANRHEAESKGADTKKYADEAALFAARATHFWNDSGQALTEATEALERARAAHTATVNAARDAQSAATKANTRKAQEAAGVAQYAATESTNALASATAAVTASTESTRTKYPWTIYVGGMLGILLIVSALVLLIRHQNSGRSEETAPEPIAFKNRPHDGPLMNNEVLEYAITKEELEKVRRRTEWFAQQNARRGRGNLRRMGGRA